MEQSQKNVPIVIEFIQQLKLEICIEREEYLFHFTAHLPAHHGLVGKVNHFWSRSG